jgi:hypothetical protein
MAGRDTTYGSTSNPAGKDVRQAFSGGTSLFRNFAYVEATSLSDPDLILEPGGIKFRSLGNNPGVIDGEAYPFFQSIKNVPLKGEIVLIVSGPQPGQKNRNASSNYYLPALNLWNNPQAGITSDNRAIPDAGVEWRATSDSNPLFPFEGDVILEGRKGQSIRLSESLSNTPWQGPRTDLSTIAIVSGIKTTGFPEQHVIEDINRDASSIYLLQGQRAELHAPWEWHRKGISSYGLGDSADNELLKKAIPTSAHKFTGNQIMMNSGRLYFNAKTEHILMSAQRNIGLLGNQVHLDAISNISFEAPRLNLTAGALNPITSQHAVRGDQLLLEIENLYALVTSLCYTLSDFFSAQDIEVDSVEALKTYLEERTDNNAQLLREALLSKTVFLS